MKGPRINEEINAENIRLIDPDGGQIGVVGIKEALAKAAEFGLDLVEINRDAKPPVVKILDWGKYRYELSKKTQEQKRKNKPKEAKTIKLSLKIGQHDFENKAGQAKKFLSKGHRVKVSLWLRGREMAHPELADLKVDQFIETLKQDGHVEHREKSGREISAVVFPGGTGSKPPSAP